MTAPTDLVTGGGSARLSWEGAISSSAVRNYDVRYVKARYDQTFGSPTYLKKWQRTRATHTSKSMPHGYTYCFSVRARNYAGKTTGWSRARCAARTLDDRSLTTLKGFSRKKKRGYYGGTYTRTTKYGSQLILRGARVDRIGIIATTCRRCGRVQVRVKGRKVGAINLYSSSYRRQQLLMLPRFTTRHGDVVLRVTSSNGQWVEIDGLAASRK
jgi:hypothetical protein